MPIVATFLGGPLDGTQVELDDPRTLLRVPVQDCGVVEMHPVLTETGWRLLWREP